MSEEKKRECIHARLDCVECAWIGGHSVAFWKAGGYVKLPQPAPEKPSADQGVTTESFDGFVWSRVLGKNVSNTLADLIRYRHRKDVDRATRELREDLTKAQGESEGWRDEAMRYQGVSEKLREENARIKADVERLTKERDESRAYADNLAMGLSHANTEAMTAKAANREQRRKGAEDAAAWLERHVFSLSYLDLRKALGRGEVLRDGEKEERAPVKTGRLPDVARFIFARESEHAPWFLLMTYRHRTGSVAVDVPGESKCIVYPIAATEGVLWCWPTPGMV